MKRTTKVQNVKINNIVSASVFQVGDLHGIDTKSKAYALQRQFPIYNSHEAKLNDYPIFSYEQPPLELSHSVRVHTKNLSPNICVNQIYIIGAATASVVQLGNSESIDSHSIVRHVRQFIGRNDLASKKSK